MWKRQYIILIHQKNRDIVLNQTFIGTHRLIGCPVIHLTDITTIGQVSWIFRLSSP